MTTEQKQLFQKIQDFRLDKEDVSFPFSKRLARDNYWSHTFALRVIDEYKKFIFLMMVSPTPITPSEEVDQAWHLHLTYTKSYWENLCEDTLQRKLHHHPTEGGIQEDAKFENWYAYTKDLYLQYFESPPPTDIWASQEKRFGKENLPHKSNTDAFEKQNPIKKIFSLHSLPFTNYKYALFCVPLLALFAFINLFNLFFFGLIFTAIYFIFFHKKKGRTQHKFKNSGTTSTQTSTHDATSTFFYATNSDSLSDSNTTNSDSYDSGNSGNAGSGSDANSDSSGGSDAGSADGGGSGCSSGCGGGGCGGGGD